MHITAQITIDLPLDLVSKLYNCHKLTRLVSGLHQSGMLSTESEPIDAVFLLKSVDAGITIEEKISIEEAHSLNLST